MVDLPAPSAPPAAAVAADDEPPPLAAAATAAPVGPATVASSSDAAPAVTTRHGGIVARRRNRDGSLAVKITTVGNRADGSRDVQAEHYRIPCEQAAAVGFGMMFRGEPPGREYLIRVETLVVPPGAAVVTSLGPEVSEIDAPPAPRAEEAPREAGTLVLAPALNRAARRRCEGRTTSNAAFRCFFWSLGAIAAIVLVQFVVKTRGRGSVDDGLHPSPPPQPPQPSPPPTLPPTQRPTQWPTLPSYWYTYEGPAGGGEWDTSEYTYERPGQSGDPTAEPTSEPNQTSPPTRFPITRQPQGGLAIIAPPGSNRESPTLEPTCAAESGNFSLCVAIDMSGSVCNGESNSLCEQCLNSPQDLPHGSQCNSGGLNRALCCPNFANVLEFVRGLIAALGELPVQHGFSIVRFGTDAAIASSLEPWQQSVLSLDRLAYSGGKTNLAGAVDSCQRTLASSPPDRTHLMVVITDGMPSVPEFDAHEAAISAAAQAKLEDTFIIPVLIRNSSFQWTELLRLWNKVSSGSIFVAEFDGLDSVTDSLIEYVACQANTR